MDANRLVIDLQKNTHSDACKNFILEHKPFILSTISARLNRYIRSENEEVFSIGLSAFLESIEKFDPDKGQFYSFAKLVIDRRVINYIRGNEKHIHEDIDTIQIKDNSVSLEEQFLLKEELKSFEKKLEFFGITVDELVESSPLHYDTRERAITIGEKTSHEKDLVDHLYRSKRLPVTKMCQRFMITRKVIYGSKNFIISVIVVFHEKLDLIKRWF